MFWSHVSVSYKVVTYDRIGDKVFEKIVPRSSDTSYYDVTFAQKLSDKKLIILEADSNNNALDQSIQWRLLILRRPNQKHSY